MNNEITCVDLTMLGTTPAAVVAALKPATAVAGVLVVAKLTKIVVPDPT
jgi:hypothetical protein